LCIESSGVHEAGQHCCIVAAGAVWFRWPERWIVMGSRQVWIRTLSKADMF
jgi:hypothetical protein